MFVRATANGRAPGVAGAFLVAPADVEEARGLEPCASFAPIPAERLSFPTLLVASRTDPYLMMARAELRHRVGSTLVDAGDAGHLNTASGHGAWLEAARSP